MKTWIVFIISILFVSVSYGEWVPSTFNNTSVYSYYPQSDAPKSLMISLHGCRQKNTEMVKYGNWDETAEKHNVIVVAPDAPNGGVVAKCWNYFGRRHNINKSHAKFVNELTEAYVNNPELNIDPNHVYISGFSSGGGMALVMSCLRPDLYAGVGAAAGPGLGSSYLESTYPATYGKSSAKLCKKLAGENVDSLKTMVSSVVHANVDMVVHPKYSKITREMFSILTEKDLEEIEFDIGELSNWFENKGSGSVWNDGEFDRVSKIVNNGLGHNWPSGNGTKGKRGQVKGQSINYPKYLIEFLTSNNQRAYEYVFGAN